MGWLPLKQCIKDKKTELPPAFAPGRQQLRRGRGLITGLCSQEVRAGSLLPGFSSPHASSRSQRSPPCDPGGWAKEGTLLAGFAPSPQDKACSPEENWSNADSAPGHRWKGTWCKYGGALAKKKGHEPLAPPPGGSAPWAGSPTRAAEPLVFPAPTTSTP